MKTQIYKNIITADALLTLKASATHRYYLENIFKIEIHVNTTSPIENNWSYNMKNIAIL